MAQNLTEIPVNTITGAPSSLGEYAGKVALVVNVASKCGLTPQYEALEKLYTDKKAQGLVVLGFPANDFGAQEPGTNDEIQQFCTTNFGVDFPMFEKITVTGTEKHPLYAALTQADGDRRGAGAEGFRERLRGAGMTPTEDPEILWNFEKFVIAKDGSVAARFAPTVTPDDPDLLAVIDAELAK